MQPTAPSPEAAEVEETSPEAKLVRSLLAPDESLVRFARGYVARPWWAELFLGFSPEYCLVVLSNRRLHVVVPGAMSSTAPPEKFHHAWLRQQLSAEKWQSWPVNAFTLRTPDGILKLVIEQTKLSASMDNNVRTGQEIHAALTGSKVL